MQAQVDKHVSIQHRRYLELDIIHDCITVCLGGKEAARVTQSPKHYRPKHYPLALCLTVLL